MTAVALTKEIEKKTTEKEPTGLLEKGLHVGERLAQTVIKGERVKDQLSHAIEDLKEEVTTEAQRTIKRTQRAAEDLSEEAAYRIKREPFRAVAYVFSAGLVVGALVSWAFTQRKKECS